MLFKKLEKFESPSTILFRSIEAKLLKENISEALNLKPALDLGCGEGIIASAIFSGKVDFGLDNDEEMVKQAKLSRIYKKVIQADAKNMPLKRGCTKLVFSNSVIEHIKDLEMLLKEVRRILSKGGLFVFTVPSSNFAKYSLISKLKINLLTKIYGRMRNKKFNHYHCYSKNQWNKILERQGFRLVKGYYYISKDTLIFWDFLLILFFPLRIFGKKLSRRIYKTFFRNKIYGRFKMAKTFDSTGAALCIAAQKI